MKKLAQNKNFWLVFGIFIGIALLIVMTVIAIGGAYGDRIESFINPKPPAPVSIKKRPVYRKITIIKPGEPGCIEVTPDGTVRVYGECGGELETAARLDDPINIFKLFRLISSREGQKLLSESEALTYEGEGTVYQLIIETDEGTQTVYLVADSNADETTTEIIETIQAIKEDIPTPSPTPSPTATPVSSPVGTPKPSASGVVSPTPTPETSEETGGTESEPDFVCDFSDSDLKQKPYRVSGVVCTTEPSPVT